MSQHSNICRLRFRTWHSLAWGVCLVAVWLSSSTLIAADLVEFLSGAKASGTMKQIRKEKKEFDFEVQLGNRKLTRTSTLR